MTYEIYKKISSREEFFDKWEKEREYELRKFWSEYIKKRGNDRILNKGL